jgi:apolipoprotein N-acyltransferase
MDRLDRLERSLRRWKVGTLAAVGLAFGAGAAQDSTPQNVDVRTLNIVDGQGRTRIKLDPDWGIHGPAIAMYSKDGKVAASIQVWDESASQFTSMVFKDTRTGKDLVRITSLGRDGKVEVATSRGQTAQLSPAGANPF